MRIAKSAAFAVALLVAAAIPASAQTNWYVDSGGSDLNSCLVSGAANACATITGAIGKAASGDKIIVAAGTYPEYLVISMPLTVQCANSGTEGYSVGRLPESIIQPVGGGVDPIIHISASNVTIDGCELDGSLAEAQSGIYLFAGADGVTIENNYIHDIDRLDPGVGTTLNYSYGVQTLGGGVPGTRSAITDLVIADNLVENIGAGVGGGNEETGGLGLYLKSLAGGAEITGNHFSNMLDGQPSVTTAGLGGTFELGGCIALTQDDDATPLDFGATVSDNACELAFAGVVAGTEDTDIMESRAAYPNGLGDVVGPMVINMPAETLGDPVATVDPTNLAPYFVSTDLALSSSVAPDAIGYFKTSAAAAASIVPGGSFSPVPSDLTIDGVDITEVGGMIRFTFSNGDVIDVDPLDLTNATLLLEGTAGDETVTIDSDVLALGIDLVIDLGDGTDTLVIDANTTPANAITTIAHQAYDAHSGLYTVDFTVSPDGSLEYFGLDPIFDNMSALNRVFSFTAAGEGITLEDDGTVDDNVSRISSDNSEVIDFVNPTVSLTINALGGDDTVYLYPLDTDGLGVTPAIAMAVNGGLGADHFHVHPLADPGAGDYASYLITGGAPAICPGDELHVDAAYEADLVGFSGGNATFDPGTWFGFTYTGIEAFPNYHADIELTASPTLYPGDLATYTLTVTNNGPDDAQCIVVADALPAGLVQLGPVATSAGFLSPNAVTGPDWIIASLASGGSETLVVDVFVNEWQPLTVSATTGTTDDDLTNNTVDLIGTTFKFPAATVAQKAIVYRYTVDDGVNGPEVIERLIVGLYQGAPSLTGAVLCQIPVPDPLSVYYTINPAFVANRWRECADGLPYPLHPNDLMEDANGRLWVATWGYAGLYYSDDGAQTWIESEPNLANVPDGWVNIFAIAEDVSGFLYISANDGKVFFSLNGGNTWVLGGSLPWVDADTPWSLVADPIDPGVIYAGTFGRGVFVSYDFTQTWEPLGNDAVLYPANPDEVNDDLIDMSQGHIFDLEFSPDDPEVLFAATALGVFMIDLGVPAPAWVDTGLRQLPGDLVGPEVRSLAFDLDPLDPDDDLYVATWGFGVYRLEDPIAGGVWDFYQLRNQEVTFVAPGPNGGIMAGTSSGEIVQFSGSISTANETDGIGDVPTEFELGQNYPNPFNPTTTIEFSMPEATAVRLAVYDMLGREVKVLVNGVVPAGRQTVQFDATGLPSGNYLYRMTSSLGSSTKHLVLLK